VRDTPKRFVQRVGRRIAELRKARGLTQQDLADRLDMGMSQMQRLERGRHAPTLGTIWRIAKALRVEPVQLFVTPEATAKRLGRPKEETVAREVPWAMVGRSPLK